MRDKWVATLATIVESQDAPPGATGPTFGHAREHHDYLVEVQSPNGQAMRAHVGMQSLFIHAVGEPLPVEVNFKTSQVRIDKPRMAEMIKRQRPFSVASQPRQSGAVPGDEAPPASAT